MATFDYNPITGQLDLVGGGASYIDGVVADSSLLPVTLGSPALDSVYLAKVGSGVWLISRKPAGLYVRVANNGVAADWTYLGAFPEVNADGNWELYNTADPTKELKFDLASITTGTTRTLTAPNSSGTISIVGHTHIASDIVFGQFANNRINWASPDPIGGSVASSGVFTTLTANTSLTLNGTGAAELINAGAAAGPLQIYNTFTSATNHERGFLKWSSNVFQVGTEKGSGGGTARALAFQTDGVTRMTIASTGAVSTAGNLTVGGSAVPFYFPGGLWAGVNGAFAVAGALSLNNSLNAIITADAANIIAIRNGATGQTFRVYNKDGANFERANFRWASDEFILDAEKGGTGTLRGIKIGSATSSLLGFFGATPVVQQAAVADATDAASTQARLNDLLARLRTLGLIAT